MSLCREDEYFKYIKVNYYDTYDLGYYDLIKTKPIPNVLELLESVVKEGHIKIVGLMLKYNVEFTLKHIWIGTASTKDNLRMLKFLWDISQIQLRK
jgi:hypothetical protein